MKCDLCTAVSSKHFREYGDFILIPKCNTCSIPLLVSKTHEPNLARFQQMEFDMLMESKFKEYKVRGIGMRSNKEHWHEHLIRVMTAEFPSYLT